MVAINKLSAERFLQEVFEWVSVVRGANNDFVCKFSKTRLKHKRVKLPSNTHSIVCVQILAAGQLQHKITKGADLWASRHLIRMWIDEYWTDI